MRMAMRANVEDRDSHRLSARVKAASVGHGVLCLENQKLCQTRNTDEQQHAEIGNLTANREDASGLHLGQVHRDIRSDARIYLPPLPDLWRLRRAQTPALFGRTQPGACELSGVYEVSVLKPAEDKRKESIALFTVTLTTWQARTSSSLLR